MKHDITAYGDEVRRYVNDHDVGGSPLYIPGTPPFQYGDRVECQRTTLDTPPLEEGDRGTVVEVDDLRGFPAPCWMVHVRWDNGRTWPLCIPPDTALKLEEVACPWPRQIETE